MKRIIVYLSLFVFGLSLFGCQSAPERGPRRIVRQSAAKEEAYELKNLGTVAFLGLSKSVQEKDVIKLLEPVIEDHLMASSCPFILIDSHEVTTRTGRFGVSTLYNDIVDFWQDKKKVDKFKLQEFCEKISTDAILVGNIEEWQQSRAIAGSDEPSFTQISARFSIYLAETGRKIWEHKISEILEAEVIDAGGTTQTDLSGGGGVAGRGLKAHRNTDPPKYDDVIIRVAEELANAIK